MNVTGKRLLGAVLSWILIAFVIMTLLGLGGALTPAMLVGSWVVAGAAVAGGLVTTARGTGDVR